MVENRTSLFGIIAIIIGTVGLGFGIFSVVNLRIVEGPEGPRGLPGEDGIDGIDGINGKDGIDGKDVPGYYCNSATEIQQVLDTLGIGSGKIIINKTITLTESLHINGGGNYLIQGRDPYITINAGGSFVVFDITSTLSCTIQDLKIHAYGDLDDRNIIRIDEANNNPVSIENIQILGGSKGYGVYVRSDNVQIRNCYFNDMFKFVVQPGSNNAWICDNQFIRSFQKGVEIYGDNNYFARNTVDSTLNAFYVESGSNNVIIGNIIRNVGSGIVLIGCDNNIITNNIMNSITSGDAIHLEASDSNLISDNFISDVANWAFYGEDVDNNIISGNIISYASVGIFVNYNCFYQTIIGNEISYATIYGIILRGSYSSITGNMITYISSNTSSYISGVEVYGDYNSISGNIISHVTNYNVMWDGIGIYINGLAEYCVVMGNVAQDCDINWLNQNPTTIGNATTNSFS